MYLTDEQRKRLARRAQDEGTSEAAVMRAILDEALGIEDDNVDELVAAIDAAFGICKDYPDWPEWLRQVRGGLEVRMRDLDER